MSVLEPSPPLGITRPWLRAGEAEPDGDVLRKVDSEASEQMIAAGQTLVGTAALNSGDT
jgi:hypothetical protein